MLSDMFRRFFKRDTPAQAPAQKPEQTARKRPRSDLGGVFSLEFDEVSNGYGGYHMVDACLLRTDAPGFCRCIIDEKGRIRNFPGVREGEWEKDLEYPLDDQVRFAFWVGDYKDGRASVSWMLQPDGRYFEDEDGFGAEHCVEICLYSCLDEDGNFTEPFHSKQ